MRRLPRGFVVFLVMLWAILAPAAWAQESRGQADVGVQGYYLGGESQKVSDITGVTFQFQHFLPRLGLLSGSLESYDRDGRFETGNNYLELRGLPAGGYRWTFTGGDFRATPVVVDFPFHNVFYPELTARGVRLEASRTDRQFLFYFGEETLLQGPRVPFRLRVPQTVLGASVRQTFAGRWQLGVRFLGLASSPETIAENPFYFPRNREFSRANLLAVQSIYTFTPHLRFYAEASGSDSQRPSGVGRRNSVSSFVGPIWESSFLTLRANYTRQQADYLPVLGYFLGDREGPFAEARLRPFRRLELYGSASRYRNNLARDPDLPAFLSRGQSAGLAVSLPLKFSINGQLSRLRYSVNDPNLPAPRDSDNRQIMLTLSRPMRRHNLRLSGRDLKMLSNLRLERQRSLELEDVFQWKRLVLGAAVRGQRVVAEQRRNTLFVRGFGQIRLGRLTAYGNFESGSDLVNRTVFATNTFQTTVIGVTARLPQSWSLDLEAFRNRLTTELNPENIFLLGNSGVGLSNQFFGLNQWSVYFRLTKQITWGSGPVLSTSLDQYVASQVPLVGTVEGFVHQQAREGPRLAPGIPVSLDQSITIVTDAEGRFRFVEVPEGPHQVSLALRELPADFDPGARVEMTALVKPRGIARVDLDVLPLTLLSGRITATGEARPADIVIRLHPTDRYTLTDADGAFAFYNLREGDYELAVDAQTLPPNTRLTGAGRLPVSATLAGGTTLVQFALELIPPPERPIRRVLEQQLVIEPPQTPPPPR